MRRPRVGFATTVGVAAMVLPLALGGCGSQPTTASDLQATAAPQTTAAIVVTDKDFDRARFSDPTTIDNRWFPLEPGTQLVYEGSAIDEGETIARRVVFTVTDLTKVIGGVRTVVGWDRDYNDRRLVEPELVFFAQDDSGNVWTLGQYPEEYDDGELVKTPAWIAGLQDAKAGLVMRAQPRTGTSDYSQGLGPKVQYADRAKVLMTGRETCVAFDCYQDVVVTQEWDSAEPAARQLKHYAPSVGNVRIGWTGRDQEKEELELTKMVKLGPDALADARREALELERRAYLASKDLYGRTAPAEQPG